MCIGKSLFQKAQRAIFSRLHTSFRLFQYEDAQGSEIWRQPNCLHIVYDNHQPTFVTSYHNFCLHYSTYTNNDRDT